LDLRGVLAAGRALRFGQAAFVRTNGSKARGCSYTQAVTSELLSQDTARLVMRFHEARRREDLVVLQGFHALKHALRFDAEVEVVACADPGELTRLAQGLAPELSAEMQRLAVVLPAEAFKRLGPYVPHTGVVSIAHRVATDPLALLAGAGKAPVVLLEDPRHLGNLGAVIRVAAAVEAAGVLTTGRQDPWDPVAVRGSAGLHFALPVARVERLPTCLPSAMGGTREGETGRPLLAFDPEGQELRPELVPPRALLAFGTERDGLSDQLLETADARLRLPMRAGVSSLNLATSVAAVLYSLRLSG
jgi:TrmH family RNA methyltransferase